MARKYALLFLVMVLLVVAVNLSVSDTGNSLVFAHNQPNGVVDKAEGNWSVNIAFEDEVWSQTGTAQNLVLNPGETETLTWTAVVPANATVDSVARLVVYYNDSFKALNWWIHVVPGAELSIRSSSVE
jgi:hypothetical protein